MPRVAPDTLDDLDVLRDTSTAGSGRPHSPSKGSDAKHGGEKRPGTKGSGGSAGPFAPANVKREAADTGIWGMLLGKRAPPPLPWERSRQLEIAEWIRTKSRLSIVKAFVGEKNLYWLKTRHSAKYYGERSNAGLRDGRGVATWPDPPKGGGEQYLGLWRDDQPCESGVFCWYSGDTYMGQLGEGGKLQGSGVYRYGMHGGFGGDVYRGSYQRGSRTGCGFYEFSPNESRKLGGEYAGDWLNGAFHGHGILRYSDGESYHGEWAYDKKHGFGRYTWGAQSVHSGDYYQGELVRDQLEGAGCTRTSDGGFHKGDYQLGERQGWGVQRTAAGVQHMGRWAAGELDGEVVTFNAFLALRANSKSVQTYSKGAYVSTRQYKATDYIGLELPALEAEMRGEEASKRGQEAMDDAKKRLERVQTAEEEARKAEESALYWAGAALQLKRHQTAWFGLKGVLFPNDLL